MKTILCVLGIAMFLALAAGCATHTAVSTPVGGVSAGAAVH
ncbi:MAG TPA: hypothetical protein VIM48_07715 [Chthoniobacterales bacterium]